VTQRRYNEEEVAAIFERAAEAQHTSLAHLPAGEGMTLTDLQEIAREVGISGDDLADAAKAIDLGGRRPTSRRLLGFPVGVGLTVDLGRTLSDEEWERFVVDLRETFDTRGVLKSEGSLRTWANGNLQAHLEPTGTGHRIRLRTVKGDARGLILGGLGIAGSGIVAFLISAFGGVSDAGLLSSLGVVTASGAAMFAVGALRLPGWARLRRRQMKGLGERIATVASLPPASDRKD
jgi:hypothetical protein